ncbi:MRNA capping enzyme alpha subunit [Spironucleus salmonicida]|uniref:mRNA guanylyltransferase n=1 Tax=Spironucleus salmonicida TaxID=348837 RepID=V6LYP7_9EUKA|nr:MRNA capping enzyme alpha subunit [Spironucleus salmonicida]|eukprot:EST45949.1 mRNA capping enzyme alpha subunit [Spironucleus salmonicida]
MDQLTAKFLNSLPTLQEGEATALKDEIASLLHLDTSNGYRFPGAQPVSLEPKIGLSLILQNDFAVCEKTDGTRYLFFVHFADMTIPQPAFDAVKRHLKTLKPTIITYFAYFIDREYTFKRFSCDFDLTQIALLTNLQDAYSPTCFSHFNGLYDGELVAEKGETESLHLYLFDCLFNSVSVMSKPLYERLEASASLSKICVPDPTNLKICSKFFTDKTQISQVLEQKKGLLHHSDGLIFTKVRAGYQVGTTHDIQKWKPLNQNSVDLLVQLEQETAIVGDTKTMIFKAKFYTASRGIIEPETVELGGIQYLAQDKFAKLMKLSKPVILEVFWNSQKEVTDYILLKKEHGLRVLQETKRKGAWESLKIRKDKSLPNDRKVFDSVVKSYDEFVDIDMIMDILAGKSQIPGVCTEPSPFLLRKKGNLNIQMIQDE